MRFASVGSGSEGNALLVETTDGHSRTRLLIDCGFGVREATRRLRAAGVEPEALDAILVTHEHGDHIGGAFRLSAAFSIPVYLTHGTLQAAGGADATAGAELRFVDPHASFAIGGFRVEPIPVPHDAREPVQYRIEDGRASLGVLTDLGHGTPHVVRMLSGVQALVLECNHDAAMLMGNPRYPASLKRRIGGPYGHLENAEAARILAAIDRSRLRAVVAAHLSRHNNTPELARQALAGALEADARDILVADQDVGVDWIEV